MSDIEYFFIIVKKKGTPIIYDLIFKTHPIQKEHHLKMLVNCNVNKALPFDDEFYMTFILDNGRGGDYSRYIPFECLIHMESITDIEDVSRVIRDTLGIKEDLSPPNNKKLERLDFHTWY